MIMLEFMVYYKTSETQGNYIYYNYMKLQLWTQNNDKKTSKW